jgi:DNA (cytosine-5)-methyltransferase 1
MGQKIVLYPRRRGARPSNRPTCIDLFSGAGGLAVGFRAAGWAVIAGNDADPDAGETFRLNFPEASFFQGPISSLTASKLMAECGIRRGQLDCLIGGPPCQSFSYNNHQRSADDERARLFRSYLRLVAGLKPKMLVMENVPGILTIGANAVIDEISAKLTALGYDVSVKVLNASEFGTPQSRRRVFVIASRIGQAHEILPAKSRRTVTVGDAISDLPRLASGGGRQVAKAPKKKPANAYQKAIRRGTKQLFNHKCHDLGKHMLTRIKHVPEGGNWRDIPRRLLTAGMRRARKSDHTKRYGRLARKGLASTILTKCDPHWGAYVHPTQHRTISVREAARLQGFPDAFRFAGDSQTKHYVQVGNAVPVPLAKAIAKKAAKHLQRHWRNRR